jgi:peptidoglycan/LPS O-acetylase OafA/YrhL
MSEKDTVLYRVLNASSVAYIGVISYSLYIWHMLFLSHYAGPAISVTVLHDGMAWWLPSLALASMSYFLLEKPLLGLRARFQKPRAPNIADKHEVAATVL